MTSVAPPSTMVEISDPVRAFLANSPQKLLIGGKWVSAKSGGVMDVVNPATGETLTRVAKADEKDVDRVVSAASTAFENPGWRWMPANERGHLLYKMAELIAERAADIAQAETLNVGKPLFQAEDDVETVVDCFRYYAGAARLLEGATPISSATPCTSRSAFASGSSPGTSHSRSQLGRWPRLWQPGIQ